MPLSATLNSISTFSSLKKKAKGPGTWESIGPTRPKYPAVLNQFLAGGKPVRRLRARHGDGARRLQEGNDKCTLYVAAAGGGVWRPTRRSPARAHWDFISGSFGTNAIGSLLIDPSDPSGNTVYAGTGEPNASGDSEAGVGIYKSTDGGDTWTLVPGSDIFFQRAIGDMALDNDGNLLVPIASAVRGISSVTSGACRAPTTAIRWRCAASTARRAPRSR